MAHYVDLVGAMQWAVSMCNNPNVGYNQSYRNFQTVDGLTYFDCSSFTFFALWLGGGLDVGAFGYSTNLSDYQNGRANAWVVTSMISALRGDGWWDMPVSTDNWEPMDILAKTRTHTEFVYSKSPLQIMGARNRSLPFADQVAIHPGYSGYFDVLLRYPEGEPPTPPIPGSKPMPIWLIKRAKELNGFAL